MTVNFFYFSSFILGLVLGSFLNVVVYRLNIDDNPLVGRSYCPHCKKKIRWFDNFPLV
ncbi:prepilin peptidase, partial [Patescibacteria group bacterium]